MRERSTHAASPGAVVRVKSACRRDAVHPIHRAETSVVVKGVPAPHVRKTCREVTRDRHGRMKV
jgi:hypothetical protein